MTIWWKLGMGAVALAAAFLLVTMYGGVQYKRGRADEASAWTAKQVLAEKAKLVAYQKGVETILNSDKSYIETVREKLVPFTKTIIERSTDYAKTPDGQLLCLPPERVLWLDQATANLFDPPATTTASGTHDALSTDALGNDARRVDE